MSSLAPLTAPPPLPPPPAGTQPNLRCAFGGVWRLTWRRQFAPSRWLIGALGGVALGLLSVLGVRVGSSVQFFGWAAEFYLAVLVPVAAFLAGAGAIRDDMRSASVDYVLTRPVPRPAFVIFRYVSHLACAQLVGLLALVVVFGAGAYREVPDLAALAPRFLLAQGATITAFLALGFLCGAFTARYLVLGLLYGSVVEVGIGRIPIQLNRLSILHHVRTLLESGAPAAGSIATTIGLLVAIPLVLIALAAMLFSRREFAGDSPKDA
jgi:ABC-2 type transport system permease protein